MDLDKAMGLDKATTTSVDELSTINAYNKKIEANEARIIELRITNKFLRERVVELEA